MILTSKYGLKVPEDTDLADLKVFVGDNMTILDGHSHEYSTLLNIPTTFTPPLTSMTERGGHKLGDGLIMQDEFLEVNAGQGLSLGKKSDIAIITADLSHIAYKNTEKAFTNMGYNVTGILETDVPTMNLSNYGLIALVRYSDYASTETIPPAFYSSLDQYWNAGIPFLLGMTKGTFDTSRKSYGSYKGIYEYEYNPSIQNDDILPINFNHYITQYSIQQQTKVVTLDYMARIQGLYKGTLLAQESSSSTNPYLVVFEKNLTTDLNNNILPTSVVWMGFLYGRMDYHSNGTELIQRSTQWLLNQNANIIETSEIFVNTSYLNTLYSLKSHYHTWVDIVNKPSTFTPPIASTTVVGGGLLGNGLSVSGNYIYVKTNSALGTNINTAGAYEVMIDRTVVDTWYHPKNTTGTGVPTTVPISVGLLHIDTTNRNAYISTGTTATTDWEQIDFVSTGGGTWGSITGTLANQTDLQTALDNKFDKAGGTIAGQLTVDSSGFAVISSMQNNNGRILYLSIAQLNSLQSINNLGTGTKDLNIEGFEGGTINNINLQATNVNVLGSIYESGVSLTTKYASLNAPNFTGIPTINGNEILSQSPSVGSNNPLFIWSGTQAEYDQITTKDSNTLYFITGV